MSSACQVSALGRKGASSCDALLAKAKHYQKLQWATPIFTAKRVAYERKANAYFKKYDQCKAGKGKGKDKKVGYPRQPPHKLWRMDPNKRPIDVVGIVNNLAGGEDTVIAIAKGARTSFLTRPVEDRATIRAGIGVLKALGVKYQNVNEKALKSDLAQGARENAAVVHAVGMRGDVRQLSAAANKVRREVSRYGKGAEKAAWGMRGLYILQNLKGLQAARSAGAGIAGVFFPIGTLIAAAVEIHGAISSAVAKEVVQRHTRYVKEGIEEARARLGKKQEKLSSGAQAFVAPPPGGDDASSAGVSRPFGVGWGWWAAGAALAVAGVAVATSRSPQ